MPGAQRTTLAGLRAAQVDQLVQGVDLTLRAAIAPARR
jgi:hypothetical protein